ncbi:MAG: RHS repeat-associated core domain-containing protein, partial [Limisphaerales bacterium]
IQVWIGNVYEEKGGKILFHVFAGSQQICTFEATSPLNGGSDSSKVGYYYNEDNLNTSSALSDSSKNQIEVDVYYPFGRTQTASPQASFQVSRRFTGQVFDAESGLYYYNARYYDPELGRFIQPDTIIPDLSNPQSYNRYSYCLNDPLRYTDPSGHGAIGDALYNEGTFKSSYQLITMRDSFGWKVVEVPVGVLGIGVATADTALNFVSGGTKGVVEGGAKDLIKTGVEELGKEGGEKTAAAVEKTAGKDVPNPFGKKGGPEHQATVNDVEKDVRSRGLEPQREYKVETPGGNKNSRYIDIVGRDSEGNVVEMHQVGRQTQGGLPVSRERQAIQDVQNATGKTPQFHPYNKQPPAQP